MPSRRPSADAHSAQRCPAGRSAAYARSNEPVAQIRQFRIEPRQERLRRQPAPGVGVHRLVAGRAHAPLDVFAGGPPRRAPPGCSPRARPSCAPRRTRRAPTFRQRQIFDQNHSEEYVPPIGARYSGACAAAIRVMAAASSAPVWSFHSHAWAASTPAHFGSSASGRLWPSTGMGVEPVVSTPMPITRSAEKSASRAASAIAPLTDARSPSR